MTYPHITKTSLSSTYSLLLHERTLRSLQQLSVHLHLSTCCLCWGTSHRTHATFKGKSQCRHQLRSFKSPIFLRIGIINRWIIPLDYIVMRPAAYRVINMRTKNFLKDISINHFFERQMYIPFIVVTQEPNGIH